MSMQQQPPATAQEPVTVTPEWTVRPETYTPPLVLNVPQREFTYDPSIDPLPYRGPRFETDTPESFGEWHRGNRRDVRESLLNGEMPSLRSLGLLALGQFLRSNDTERDQFEIRDLRSRGEYEPTRDEWQR